jgi:hypothetical protein
MGFLTEYRTFPPHKSKPTHVPENLPPHFPNQLKPPTRLTLGEAIRKFPVQAETLELCRYVVSDLTPHFSVAAQRNTIRPDQVEDIMNDLLHYTLVANCDNSNERFRLKQEVRRSDEWLKLSREVAQVAADASKSIPTARGDEGQSQHKNDPPRPDLFQSGNVDASGRRAAINAYIDEVFEKTGRRITRTDIWKAARYRSRTEFERWQRNAKNPNKVAGERFAHILIEKPHLKK